VLASCTDGAASAQLPAGVASPAQPSPARSSGRRSPPPLICCPAGPPPNDASRYCPQSRPGAVFASTTPTCYSFNGSTASFSTHQAACQALGGNLATYYSYEEQVDVETKLQLWNKSSNIWLGVRPGARQQWYLLDGTLVGNGEPSNTDPYAHW
jgi:hypothetical protein